MTRKLGRIETRFLDLNEIWVIRKGDKPCLRNYIRLSDTPKKEERLINERRKEKGLPLLEREASSTLDSTQNGVVSSIKRNYANSLEGRYRIDFIYYGNTSVPDADECVGLSFKEYVSLGRPKKIKLSTARRISAAK